MPEPQSERRTKIRTQLRVPVTVRSENAPEITATTRDLSSSGIFFYSESPFEPGARFELVLMLPEELGIGIGGWTLCQASVVRVENSADHQVGIAAKFDRVEHLPELAEG